MHPEIAVFYMKSKQSFKNASGFGLGASHLRWSLDHLAGGDADLADHVQQWGYPPERRSPGGFAALLRIVIGQQLSVKAAATIAARVEALMPDGLTPAGFLNADEASLRAAGLSGAKVIYGRGLARAVYDGAFDPAALAVMPDDKVTAEITALKGFGIWSARMYLMFSLGRPDIWPADDLGVREGLRRLRRLEARPSIKEAEAMGAGWAPYRSSVALFCWHILNNAPLKAGD
ncbi:DNA-3-methyladenine glycosylase 1 [alpha proteobacterium Q-1]|nr:DNA-3-methyladenine glycosylase 1 [alpha proteobacterium Q-1]